MGLPGYSISCMSSNFTGCRPRRSMISLSKLLKTLFLNTFLNTAPPRRRRPCQCVAAISIDTKRQLCSPSYTPPCEGPFMLVAWRSPPYPGANCTFRSKMPDRRHPSGKEETYMLKRRRQPLVFVVDDEHMIASSLATILRHLGFDATSFTDPLAALKAAHSQHPDLLITDVVMPQLSGIELALQVEASR